MMENFERLNPSNRQPIETEKPQETVKLSSKQILDLPPKEMADLLANLSQTGKLEKFLTESAENDALVAQFSYWEKWLEKDQRKLVDQVVAAKRKIYEGQEDTESLPLHLEKKFTSEELSLIFSATGAIQLSFGCSKSCPFCAFDATPGVREHIPYSQVANLFQKYGNSLSQREPILYWASEPSDYASKIGLEDKTYTDVHQLAVEYAGYLPHVTSRASTDKGWLEFLKDQTTNPRVSAYGYPIDKVEEILDKAEGEIIVLRGYGKGEHTKGIGVSSLDYGLLEKGTGIGCIDGVLLTPRGLYNIARLPISKEFPQGQIIVPLESVSPKEVRPGDKLKDVLRSAVVVEESRPDQWDTFTSESFIRGIKIRTKDRMYNAWYDKNGAIKQVAELNAIEEETKKVQATEARKLKRQQTAEDRKNYQERIKKLADRKSKFMEYLANWRREHRGESHRPDLYNNEEIIQTKQEIYDAIGKAIDKGGVECWTRRNLEEHKKWLREKWNGYKYGINSVPDEYAEYVLSSRNSVQELTMGIDSINIKYDKWRQEAVLFVRESPI